MNFRALAGIVAIAVTLTACRESDEVASPGENARIEVSSDPEGASIFLDGSPTGKVTPSLLRDLIGRHEVLVRQDRDGVTYGYRAQVDVKGDSLHRVSGPLMMRCGSLNCAIESHRYHIINSMRVASNPNGALFYYDASEKGLYWPSNTINGYASIGTPLISMVAGTRDTLALGIYDVRYFAGRPAPTVTQTADRYTMKQTMWVVPPTEVIGLFAPTVRGIEVEEELIGTSATNDVAFIKLTFRNITNRPSYRDVDPIVAPGGITYNWVYIGFGLDADVGRSTDDMITYAPSLDMVFTYDHDFQDDAFPAGTNIRPGIVGLRLLEAPAGATMKALNGWAGGNDWEAGFPSERAGWYVLSGTRSSTPDQPGQQIGHVPTVPNDYRMSVAAGPISLAPGASASITVAVIMALPVPGTFNPGQAVNPDNPTTSGRAIERIAAALLDKAQNLTVPN